MINLPSLYRIAIQLAGAKTWRCELDKIHAPVDRMRQPLRMSVLHSDILTLPRAAAMFSGPKSVREAKDRA
jgi:hypothetical protein